MTSNSELIKEEHVTGGVGEFSLRRLQETERLASLGEVLGGVAHEINNPLQIILGKAQILLMRLSGEKNCSGSKEDLKAIEKNSQRIAELLNCLNDIGWKESEEEKVNTVINLNNLAVSIISLIRAGLKDKKIELETSIPENLPRVRGNPAKIKELLLYLALNAKLRLNRGGKLGISFKKDDKFLMVEFNDKGEEYSPNTLKYLENPLSESILGKSYFGLLGSYRIVNQHRGSLTIKSNPGKGNTATVRLPSI
ncbi:MAG: HAMP domain-containing histidine kinase [candidate division Zixibacteria bacterium]|nr:HAMP domain-containing histidine kinase [candidate division Zixibacteria bacterium]